MTIGEKIRLHRTKQKITQKQLSVVTGLAEITIRQYEANKYVPKIDNLKKIASALNINLTEFLSPEQISVPADTFRLSVEQKTLLKYFYSLNQRGKKEALKRISELSQVKQYSSFPKVTYH